MAKRRRKKRKYKKHPIINHFKKLGYTNRYGIYLLLFLFIGLSGGFYLALKSIETNYLGALACWTVVFTPIGTAIGIVLGKIVDKSKAENTCGDKGIKFATAEAAGFAENESTINSPPI